MGLASRKGEIMNNPLEVEDIDKFGGLTVQAFSDLKPGEIVGLAWGPNGAGKLRVNIIAGYMPTSGKSF